MCFSYGSNFLKVPCSVTPKKIKGREKGRGREEKEKEKGQGREKGIYIYINKAYISLLTALCLFFIWLELFKSAM